jgi:hypothetical protein
MESTSARTRAVERCDAVTKAGSPRGTRRGLIRLLAALPLGATLTALLDGAPDADAMNDDDHGTGFIDGYGSGGADYRSVGAVASRHMNTGAANCHSRVT